MSEQSDQINQLLIKMEALLNRQEFFKQEIELMKAELETLRSSAKEETVTTPKEISKEPEMPVEFLEDVIQEIPKQETVQEVPEIVEKEPESTYWKERDKRSVYPKKKTNLEKFIGESLINKIGIIIIVLGVSLGAKYAIDNDLISPLTRILLGYAVGAGLLFFAIRLKKNYLNFSAVLLSGAMAIFYFITFAALSFYQLYTEVTAFVIMVAITVFTVYSAIRFDKQIIAHFGLAGAYAIPFLVSEDPGQIEILFSYVAIINIGILVVAFKKYWKPLYYVSFFLTWFIYFLWYTTEGYGAEQSGLALLFLGVFFLTFYTIFIAYKLLHKEKFGFDDVFLILANTFIFYGAGYDIIETVGQDTNYLGLFTFCNALIHAAVGFLVYNRKVADKSLYNLIIGLVILFITITIPVELSGRWIALLWAGEAAILFWIGRNRKVNFYEYMAYPVLVFAFFSLVSDWTSYMTFGDAYTQMTPILNTEFLTSLITIGFFGFVLYVDYKSDYPDSLKKGGLLFNLISLVIPVIFTLALFNTFRLEIMNYWMSLYMESGTSTELSAEVIKNSDLLKFKDLWVINYTALFLVALSFVNFKWVKMVQLRWFSFGLNLFLLMLFLTIGLYELSELRVTYLNPGESGFDTGMGHILIRYISMLFIGLLLYTTGAFVLKDDLKKDLKIPYELTLVVSFCWILSSELLHWLDFADSTSSYKLGLSIFWGVYSLTLIVLGIWKKKKHLRIAAIVLFGATLVKLFFYDISHLNTISKVIVFVSLGLLLLIISFLYNKYKDKIFD
jgi:uncharacterized membrane protein